MLMHNIFVHGFKHILQNIFLTIALKIENSISFQGIKKKKEKKRKVQGVTQ